MRKRVLLLACFAAALSGCSPDADSEGASVASASESPERLPAAAPPPKPVAAKPGRRERPLPAFDGLTLDDQRFSVSSLVGRRFLVFFFNPEVATAGPTAKAVAAVAAEADAHNFAVLGVAQGSDREKSRAFLKSHGLPEPALFDGPGAFAAKVGLRRPVALALVDSEGYVVRANVPPDEGENLAGVLEQELREWLRLPEAGALPSLGGQPEAPGFRAGRLEGGTFDLAAMRGEPMVLIFFLHTCPHCHSALRSIRRSLDGMPEDARPNVLGVSIDPRTLAVQDRLERDGLDFFPVVVDPDGAIREAYGANGGVPVVYVIDAEGRIVSRTAGWREDRDPPLLRMRLARIAGQPVPMLLHKTGFSGNEFCGVCHDSELDTWELTNHAGAFDTLVRHGAERDSECVSCHVVGYEQTGGYAFAQPDSNLEDVGCETCHGRGGPHLTAGHPKAAVEYEAVCVTCHNPEHSLGFDYAGFVPRVSHAANAAALASLSPEEIAAVLEERRKPRKDLLPSTASYVGSAACKSCHEAEYATWTAQPHAKAVASLEAKSETGNPACLTCHTTGFGKSGGFPDADAVPGDHPELAAVGCESCHGPGGDHIQEGARRIGSIVSLGDKCDSCVILQICGGCHDDANDPGFEFAVQEKIDRQRHGTIEAGTGRPLDAESARSGTALPSGTVSGLLEHALGTAGG